MPKTILVLDDSLPIRNMLRVSLEHNGFLVIEGGNGLEGLSKVQEHLFDCIVTDLKMPEMDGLEFIKEFRKLPNTDNCPIIVFSSITQDYLIPEVLKSGATKILIKDQATPNQLIETIKSLVN